MALEYDILLALVQYFKPMKYIVSNSLVSFHLFHKWHIKFFKFKFDLLFFRIDEFSIWENSLAGNGSDSVSYNETTYDWEEETINLVSARRCDIKQCLRFYRLTVVPLYKVGLRANKRFTCIDKYLMQLGSGFNTFFSMTFVKIT